MSSLTIIFAALFYLATIWLIVGLVRRIRLYIKTPAPLKIPLMPAPTTSGGVVLRMLREVVLFESLFKATKWTWLFGWVFHLALFAVLFRHLRYFQDPVWAPVVWLSPLVKYLAFAMLIGLLGLLIRRIFIDRVRYISAPSDYLMLLLLLGIGVSGALTTFVARTDVVAVKAFFRHWMTLNFSAMPDLPADPLMLIHLALVVVLMIIFPISKLLHAPGIFFSPTHNQIDNPREQRHIVEWAGRLEK